MNLGSDVEREALKCHISAELNFLRCQRRKTQCEPVCVCVSPLAVQYRESLRGTREMQLDRCSSSLPHVTSREQAEQQKRVCLACLFCSYVCEHVWGRVSSGRR